MFRSSLSRLHIPKLFQPKTDNSNVGQLVRDEEELAPGSLSPTLLPEQSVGNDSSITNQVRQTGSSQETDVTVAGQLCVNSIQPDSISPPVVSFEQQSPSSLSPTDRNSIMRNEGAYSKSYVLMCCRCSWTTGEPFRS